MGEDREQRQYWCFSFGEKGLYVREKGPSEGRWGYMDYKEIGGLINGLSDNAIKEKGLKENLKKYCI